MRYRVVHMTITEAARAALTRKGARVDASRVRDETVPPGFRLCCRSRPGGGHLADCIATPAIRDEIRRQERRRGV